jgi:hypothetical protein
MKDRGGAFETVGKGKKGTLTGEWEIGVLA